MHLGPLLDATHTNTAVSPHFLPSLARLFTRLFQQWPPLEEGRAMNSSPALEACLENCASKHKAVRKALLEALLALGSQQASAPLSGKFLFDLTMED